MVGKVHIRPSLPADAPRIVAGIDAVCAEGGGFYTPRYVPTPQWETALYHPESAPDHVLLIAEVGGQFAGAARLFPATRNGNKVGEVSIFVLLPFRAQGVGMALMDELLRRAEAHGYASVALSVRSGNAQALRLYRKLGFVVTGRQVREYARLGIQEELTMAKRCPNSPLEESICPNWS